MFPNCREVMGEEDSVENLDQEGYRSPWDMHQGPVRDTVLTESLAELETSDGLLNLVRVG